jgi:hypothetical protein
VIIDIADLVRGLSTYPNRSASRYKLRCRNNGPESIEVYYEITKGAVMRTVRRKFPRYIAINERFIWVLGLLRGEGLRSIGPRSSMYRFSVVNNDLAVIKAVIVVLDESRVARFDDIKTKGGLTRISYGPYCNVRRARKYWAEGLGITISKVEMARKAEPQKRARMGSCMFTLNDVLLRRIMDLIAERVHTQLFDAGSSDFPLNG